MTKAVQEFLAQFPDNEPLRIAVEALSKKLNKAEKNALYETLSDPMSIGHLVEAVERM